MRSRPQSLTTTTGSSSGPVDGSTVMVTPQPLIGLAGGSVNQTAAELQTEINTNNEAADLCRVVFENSLF